MRNLGVDVAGCGEPSWKRADDTGWLFASGKDGGAGRVATAGKDQVYRAKQRVAEQFRAARNVVPVACIQNFYNLANRADDAFIDELAMEGIANVPFFPLGGLSPRILAAAVCDAERGCGRDRNNADAGSAGVAAAAVAERTRDSRDVDAGAPEGEPGCG